MFRFQRYSSLVPMALVSLLAASCSELPTQPVVDPGSNGVQASVPMGNGASVTASQKIKGQEGGTLTAGIFTLVIPPGAYAGQATITMSQPDPSQPLVELSIFPADKNNFLVPVLLTATLPGMDAQQLLQALVIEQEADGMTTVTGSQQDLQTMTVTASLRHFSTYRVEVGGVAGSGSGIGGRPAISPKEMD